MIVNIKHKPTPYYDIYIGRVNKWLELPESKWHNPFAMKKESDRPIVLNRFTAYLLASPNLMECLYELDNKILGCYCFPKFCHGNVLLNMRALQIQFNDVWLVNHMGVNEIFNRILYESTIWFS